MAIKKKKPTMTAKQFETKRERYWALRFQLLGMLHTEQDPKRLKRLRREYDRLTKKENKVGIDPLTIGILLAILEAVIKWWLSTRKETP